MPPVHLSLIEVVWGLVIAIGMMFVARRILWWLLGIDQICSRLDDIILLSQGQRPPQRQRWKTALLKISTRIRALILARRSQR